MSNGLSVTVLGGGSFGTVIADLIASKGQSVTLWMRDAAKADDINLNRENTRYLPGIKLADGLMATSDLQQALTDADIVFISIHYWLPKMMPSFFPISRLKPGSRWSVSIRILTFWSRFNAIGINRVWRCWM